jgi:hypothetical protein
MKMTLRKPEIASDPTAPAPPIAGSHHSPELCGMSPPTNPPSSCDLKNVNNQIIFTNEKFCSI